MLRHKIYTWAAVLLTLAFSSAVAFADDVPWTSRRGFTGGNVTVSSLTITAAGSTTVIGSPGISASFTVGTTRLRVFSNAVGTCSASEEGVLRNDSLAGISTGNPTRICLCQSNGSSVYAWRNIASSAPATALGTSTTCPN